MRRECVHGDTATAAASSLTIVGYTCADPRPITVLGLPWAYRSVHPTLFTFLEMFFSFYLVNSWSSFKSRAYVTSSEKVNSPCLFERERECVYCLLTVCTTRALFMNFYHSTHLSPEFHPILLAYSRAIRWQSWGPSWLSDIFNRSWRFVLLSLPMVSEPFVK